MENAVRERTTLERLAFIAFDPVCKGHRMWSIGWLLIDIGHRVVRHNPYYGKDAQRK